MVAEVVTVTMPRAMAEALERRLRHQAVAYDEDGQQVGAFYDLLEKALEVPVA